MFSGRENTRSISRTNVQRRLRFLLDRDTRIEYGKASEMQTTPLNEKAELTVCR